MKEKIRSIVEEHWGAKVPQLVALLEERTRNLSNILSLEDYYRSGSKDQNLKKSVGGFGQNTLDIASLSNILQETEGGRTLQKDRHQRIKTQHQRLQELGEQFRSSPPTCRFQDMTGEPHAILEGFEAHMAPIAEAFGIMRAALLESRGKYDPATHEPFFKAFDWGQLDNDEMALVPPFVVFAEADGAFGRFLSNLLELVTSGKPIKVVYFRDRLDQGNPGTGRSGALKTATDLELLFISLRNVYFSQGSIAGGTPLERLIAKGMDSPRPGVLSLLTENGNPENSSRRASLAIQSRALPHFVFDPDRAGDFVSCLDLSDNPAVDEIWPVSTLEFRGEQGESGQIERPVTFADFVASEGALSDQFSTLKENGESGEPIPLADFLEMTPTQRTGKTPFVYSLDTEGRLIRLVPSRSVVAQTSDKRHLWHTLQELGGIRNPFVQAAEKRTTDQLTGEKDAMLASQKKELEGQIREREQSAVANAMRNLALRLAGMATVGSAMAPSLPDQTTDAVPTQPATTPLATKKPAESPADNAAPQQVSEIPWIETTLCTTCDECIAINKKIFAYNAEKKAIIKDPRGGPYRDIVKAAEKCSSGAIHPGMPLDPKEKDLEKWIQRAKTYQ